jgi:hypothetical protein
MEACDQIPEHVRDQLSSLANSNVWVPTTRQYWSDAARALGLVDTNEGIRFGRDPKAVQAEGKRITKVPSGEGPEHAFSGGPMPMSHVPRHFSSRMGHLHHAIRIASGGDIGTMGRGLSTSTGTSNSSSNGPLVAPNQAQQQQHMASLGGYIVYPQDIEMIPPYVYFLMRQVEPCLFTEADRFVARSKGPVGYPGFQCRHCNGHAGLGKYFPVTSRSLSTNSTSQNIHAHLLKCRKCPDVVKDRLVQLKIEKSRSPRLEPGWRKVFFDKVWARLHQSPPTDDDGTGALQTMTPPAVVVATDDDDDDDDDDDQPQPQQQPSQPPHDRATAV